MPAAAPAAAHGSQPGSRMSEAGWCVGCARRGRGAPELGPAVLVRAMKARAQPIASAFARRITPPTGRQHAGSVRSRASARDHQGHRARHASAAPACSPPVDLLNGDPPSLPGSRAAPQQRRSPQHIPCPLHVHHPSSQNPMQARPSARSPDHRAPLSQEGCGGTCPAASDRPDLLRAARNHTQSDTAPMPLSKSDRGRYRAAHAIARHSPGARPRPHGATELPTLSSLRICFA